MLLPYPEQGRDDPCVTMSVLLGRVAFPAGTLSAAVVLAALAAGHSFSCWDWLPACLGRQAVLVAIDIAVDTSPSYSAFCMPILPTTTTHPNTYHPPMASLYNHHPCHPYTTTPTPFPTTLLQTFPYVYCLTYMPLRLRAPSLR